METHTPLDSPPPRRRGRWPRRLGVVVLLLVILLAGLRLWASALLTRTINAQLPRYLAAPARLGGVELGLLAGRVTLRDLVIKQPAGFAGEPLLRLPLVRARVKVASLTGPVIEVEEITVEGLTTHLIQRKEGTNALLNVTALLLPQPASTEAPAPSTGKPPPRVHVRAIRVDSLALRYDDSTLAAETLTFALTNLNLRVDGLMLDPAGTGPSDGKDHALAALDLEILQKDRPSCQVNASARIGVISTNIPSVNAVARMIGVSLHNAGPFLKPGIDTVLGGDGFDLKLDAAVKADALNVSVHLAMANGHVWPIRIYGDPKAPTVDKGALTGALLNRPIKSVQNVAANLDNAVTAAAGGVGKAIGSTVDGAFKTVSAVGGGLFSSAGKILSGDVKGATTELGRTAAEGVSTAAGAVGSAAGNLAGGVTRAGSTVLGTQQGEDWWKAVPTRAQAAAKEVPTALEAMPFPMRSP